MDSNVKRQLYQTVASLRDRLHITDDCYPLDLPTLCGAIPQLRVSSVAFRRTPGLRGMAAPETDGHPAIILLNSCKGIREQSFICGHELLHLLLHRGRELHGFSCFDDVRANQNPFWEWQANEGSAELHLPLALLLEELAHEPTLPDDWQAFERLRHRLRVRFGLTEAMVRLRLESLKYEIEQFLDGVPATELELLSVRAQLRRGIHVRSLNDYAAEDRARSLHIPSVRTDDLNRLVTLEQHHLYDE